MDGFLNLATEYPTGSAHAASKRVRPRQFPGGGEDGRTKTWPEEEAEEAEKTEEEEETRTDSVRRPAARK